MLDLCMKIITLLSGTEALHVSVIYSYAGSQTIFGLCNYLLDSLNSLYPIVLKEQNMTNPVAEDLEEITPPNESHVISFIQNATAAPSGPHVSGMVIQASDKSLRSIHCFNV